MVAELVQFEPIALPDPRRPATMPSLPGWLARSSGAVRLEVQMTPDGQSFEPTEVMVLPTGMLPDQHQRQAMEDHLASLRSYLAETAENSHEAETSIATQIATLLMVLPSARKSELGAEAKADVYLDVLDDVPWWALKAAIRRWHKHDAGHDENNRPYDYRWAPDPGTLRRIAYGETWQVKDRIRRIEPVLQAREYVDCSEQMARGRAAMAGLKKAMRDGTLRGSMTFEEAIALGQADDAQTETQEAAE